MTTERTIRAGAVTPAESEDKMDDKYWLEGYGTELEEVWEDCEDFENYE